MGDPFRGESLGLLSICEDSLRPSQAVGRPMIGWEEGDAGAERRLFGLLGSRLGHESTCH
jgi:hypothetical protein